ncbi:MAG TPA: hypothetical protein VGE58_12900 [Daejeonella sp.]
MCVVNTMVLRCDAPFRVSITHGLLPVVYNIVDPAFGPAKVCEGIFAGQGLRSILPAVRIVLAAGLTKTISTLRCGYKVTSAPG